MSFKFDRPKGAAADVTELEYISALHQTDVQGGIRKDGSIQDVDISLFLTSRYGVKQSAEEVRKHILDGMGCHDGYMDLMQLVSLLMIPKLREEQENRLDPNNTNRDDLLAYTLEMMLHDVTGSREPKRLTKSLIKQIFHAYGETELAEDDELVEAMLRQAGASDPHSQVMLDPATFSLALTRDVQDYHPENKDKYSTNFQDVFESDGASNNSAKVAAVDEEEGIDKNQVDVPTIFTAPNLDGTAETYRSRPLVVFMWTFFVLSFQTYLIQRLTIDFLPVCPVFDYRLSIGENLGAFICTLGVSVTRWLLILLIMSGFGLVYFATAGVGNFIECKNPLYPLVGALFTGLWTWLPIYLFEDTAQQVHRDFLEYATLVLGACVGLLNIWHFISLLIPSASSLYRWMQCALVPEAIRTETRNKQAAAHKIDGIVQNALEIHSEKKQETVVPTHFGQALLNFAEREPESERVGGFRWTWRMMYSRNLFRGEGIIFSGRLLSINFTQFLTTIFILIGGLVITYVAATTYAQQVENIDAVVESLIETDVDASLATAITNDVAATTSDYLASILEQSCPTFDTSNCNNVADVAQCIPSGRTAICTLVSYTLTNQVVLAAVQRRLLDAAGLNTVEIFDSSFDNLVTAASEATDSVYPAEQSMVVWPLALGTIISSLTALSIALIMIPSATSTMLKLRSGLIPFARYPKVKTIRIAPDQTAYLRGVMFWGTIFASVLMGSIIAFIIFLFLWQVTAATARRVVTSILGSLLVLLMHRTFVICLRRKTSIAYYRQRPAAANIGLLAREGGLVALTQGFVVVRVFKLLLTKILYVGRVDIPFLSDGVGEIELFGFRIDNEPYVFLMDILQHEAHRHPYIETLGVMYLSKLKYSDSFCTTAGSSWRLIFTCVLMPWLRKYRAVRQMVIKEVDDDDDDGSDVVPPRSPPLRAVSLIDAQGYGLRAMSLVPAASGFVGGSSYNLGRDYEKDEVRMLREENGQLRRQLRQTEREKVLRSLADNDDDGRPTQPRLKPAPAPSSLMEPQARGGSRGLYGLSLPASYVAEVDGEDDSEHEIEV